MKKLSLFAVILFAFTALTACGKPADADELLQLGLEAASEVESCSSDFSATISLGGISYEVTGSVEYMTVPEQAFKSTFNILDTSIELTYTGGQLYLGERQVDVTEEAITAMNEALAMDVSYDALTEYILADSLSFIENDDSYTLTFSLDPALTKELVVERLEESALLTEEELATITGAEVDSESINVGEISFEFELDEKDFNVISSSSNIVIEFGGQELGVTGSTSNYVYNEVTEIPAP